jgi:3'-phosphoadenosine 5'-phosphosulfate sulfotransferase (PAPS reductase)/FAD synthetase
MATSRAGIDMEGLRKEESKKRDKLEVGDHDSKSDSRQEFD